jgi:hypothetical protein
VGAQLRGMMSWLPGREGKKPAEAPKGEAGTQAKKVAVNA